MTSTGLVIVTALFLFAAYLLGLNGWIVILIAAAFAAGFAYGGGVWTL